MLPTVDRKVRLPRIWSNNELRKVAPLFSGSIINVSGWKDIDKQGSHYNSYFANANEYWISNYAAESKGYQGNLKNEIFIDLQKPMDDKWIGRFDVAFNHTVLEHVFDCRKAFENICLLSKDIVITVVPFIQHQHAAYGDYWRFTPECMSLMHKENDLEMVYINYNDGKNQSIYVITVGSKNPNIWSCLSHLKSNKIGCYKEKVGNKIVSQGVGYYIYSLLDRIHQKIGRKKNRQLK